MNIIMALLPSESSDAEKYVVNLSDELLRRGHNVYILADTITRDSETEHIPFPFCEIGLSNCVRNIMALRRFIADIEIDLIHAHGADRSVYWAARTSGIPLVTTLHCFQPETKRSISPSLHGQRTVVAWEQIKTAAVETGGIKADKIETVTTGIDPDHFAPRTFKKKSSRPIVILVGGLSGHRGQIALKMMQEVFEYGKYNVRVIGDDYLPAEFAEFENTVELVGASNDPRPHLAESAVVIASGSAAVEAIMMGRPLVAVGPARSLGLIDEDNIEEAITCAFGDIDCKGRVRHNFEVIQRDIGRGIAQKYTSDGVHEIVLKTFGLKKIADRIESIYEELIERTKK